MQTFPPCIHRSSTSPLAYAQPTFHCPEPSRKPPLTEYQARYTAEVREECVITKLYFFLRCMLYYLVSPPSGPSLRCSRVTLTIVIFLVILHSESQLLLNKQQINKKNIVCVVSNMIKCFLSVLNVLKTNSAALFRP